MLTCSNCGTQNDPTRKFCLECGQRLAHDCPACGAANPPGAKFCGECGTEPRRRGAARCGRGRRRRHQARPRRPDSVVTEVRLISVMFVDLVGFTPLSERLDAEEVRELLDGYFATARQIVDRHGGVIEKFIGDAVMAVWGTPVAHEDDAERAVRTALQLVEAVGQIEVDGTSLQGRAGVLTGEAVVTVGADGQWMVAGDLVNTAARLQSVAVPGTVLVGEATYRAASGAIAFEPVGEQSLKGKTAPVPGWQALAVVARRGGSGRSETIEPPFVGRDEELRALKDHFHATEREGKPRLVTVVGQAGIGKSRLAWELEKYLDGVVETILWHEGRSPSYGDGISYWALAEIVRGRAGIAESDDPETARRQLDDDARGDGPGRRRAPLDRAAPDRAARPRRPAGRIARGAVRGVAHLLRAAGRAVDDDPHLLGPPVGRPGPARLHRAPADLGAVVADLRAGRGATRPARAPTRLGRGGPELRPRSTSSRCRTRTCGLLLGGLVSGLPEHAMRAIVERAEGVPLYAVETLRMLIDRGVLQPIRGRRPLHAGGRPARARRPGHAPGAHRGASRHARGRGSVAADGRVGARSVVHGRRRSGR